jgi:chemotaxis methyl-accepting protein methylase
MEFQPNVVKLHFQGLTTKKSWNFRHPLQIKPIFQGLNEKVLGKSRRVSVLEHMSSTGGVWI